MIIFKKYEINYYTLLKKHLLVINYSKNLLLKKRKLINKNNIKY